MSSVKVRMSFYYDGQAIETPEMDTGCSQWEWDNEWDDLKKENFMEYCRMVFIKNELEFSWEEVNERSTES